MTRALLAFFVVSVGSMIGCDLSDGPESEAEPGGAVGEHQISGPATCSQCVLRFTRVATLSGDRVIGEPRSVVRTPDGRYVVTFFSGSSEIVEFDESGRFTRVVASTGQGPGEVSGVGAMHLTTGDSLRVYDQGRVQTYSPAGRFVYADPLPVAAVWDAEPLGPSRAVVNIGTFSPDGGAAPLRLVENGRLAAAFGEEEDVEVTPATPHLMVRSLTSDGAERLWSAELTRYQIREWTPRGELLGTWTRPVPWFEPWTTLGPISPGMPPGARLVAIQWLDRRRLMVLLAVPGHDWESHLGRPVSGPGGQTTYPEADFTRIFASRVEVLDLDLGEVLLASDDRTDLITIIDGGHVAGYRLDEVGNPFIEIWRFTME